MFFKYGDIKSIYIPVDFYTKKKKRFGFVTFFNPDNVIDVLESNRNFYIGKTRVYVSRAKERDSFSKHPRYAESYMPPISSSTHYPLGHMPGQEYYQPNVGYPYSNTQMEYSQIHQISNNKEYDVQHYDEEPVQPQLENNNVQFDRLSSLLLQLSELNKKSNN